MSRPAAAFAMRARLLAKIGQNLLRGGRAAERVMRREIHSWSRSERREVSPEAVEEAIAFAKYLAESDDLALALRALFVGVDPCEACGC